MNPWFWFDNPLTSAVGSLAKTASPSLVNGWPNMLSYGTKALPSPAGLPAAIGNNLPAVIGDNLPSVLGKTAGIAGGPATAGALAAAQVMQPQPTNSGEVPFYIVDPKTGKLVPNPAAAPNMPPGSFGYGGGYAPQPPAPSASPMTDAFGSTASAPSSVPLPQPRPPAANVGAPMNIMPPQAQQQPQQPNPDLIQRFLQALSSVKPGSTNQGFYGNLTGSMFGGGGGNFNPSSSGGAIY